MGRNTLGGGLFRRSFGASFFFSNNTGKLDLRPEGGSSDVSMSSLGSSGGGGVGGQESEQNDARTAANTGVCVCLCVTCLTKIETTYLTLTNQPTNQLKPW